MSNGILEKCTNKMKKVCCFYDPKCEPITECDGFLSKSDEWKPEYDEGQAIGGDARADSGPV